MVKGMEKGKLYDYNDKLIFKGEYLNGKKWNGKRSIIKIFFSSYSIIIHIFTFK